MNWSAIISATLCAGGFGAPVCADFVGLEVTRWDAGWDSSVSPFSPDVGLVDTWRVYAIFDEPTKVTRVGVAHDGTPMVVSNVLADGSPGTGFYTSAFGEPIPLNATQATYTVDQKANDHDTYLTILREAGWVPLPEPIPETGSFLETTPGFGSLIDPGGDTITLSNRAVLVYPGMNDTWPLSDRVLVGQFSVLAGEHVQGVIHLGLDYEADEVKNAMFTTIPAPGALVVLGAAGVLRRRHRRGADRC